MWMVLCNAKDTAALWAYQGLKARGLHPVEIVSAESLIYSKSIKHCIEPRHTRTQIKLTDGRVIDSASIRGSLNRIHLLPSDHLRAANPADRRYAEQELQALFLSWLYALPGKTVNRPAPFGLCGVWLFQSKWTWLASRAGLSTGVFRQGSMIKESAPPNYLNPAARTVIVLAGRCFGASAPPAVRQGCVKLAQACEAEMLGVDFCIDADGEWIFAGASTVPEIRIGGEPLLNALFEVFQS